ncbi:hypothetical protein Hanom_Chr12g01131251 [Helianthus anomalus]
MAKMPKPHGPKWQFTQKKKKRNNRSVLRHTHAKLKFRKKTLEKYLKNVIISRRKISCISKTMILSKIFQRNKNIVKGQHLAPGENFPTCED